MFAPASPAQLVGGSLLAVMLTTAVQAAQPGKLKPDIERGEQLYLENCWHCHGKGALGDGPLAQQGPVPAPALAGRVPTDSDPWVTIIHRGKDTMPAFGPVFDRHDARRVLVWLAALDPATGKLPKAKEPEPEDVEGEDAPPSTPPIEAAEEGAEG